MDFKLSVQYKPPNCYEDTPHCNATHSDGFALAPKALCIFHK